MDRCMDGWKWWMGVHLPSEYMGRKSYLNSPFPNSTSRAFPVVFLIAFKE